MADDAVRRERRIATLIGVLAVTAVGCLMVAAALFADSPDESARPQAQVSKPAPTPTETLEVVEPAAQPMAPVVDDGRVDNERVAAKWVTEMSARTGIGPVAVEAYGRASLRASRELPSCHVGWTTLAGIGGIESGHGTTDGARLREDGRTSKPILGPALDGSSGFAAIPSDAQSQRWHGNDSWDHAVGPMQFIPSTWRKWGSDGNEDGDKDPNNIVDAAYAAARYLCASGADLRTGEGWSRAIFSYNHSNDYVRSVLARANQYAR